MVIATKGDHLRNSQYSIDILVSPLLLWKESEMKKMIQIIKRFACWIGWHSWGNYYITDYDGCSVHVKCKWCDYEGMIDSQGNLF